MPTPEEIKERMDPKHLSTEDLKDNVKTTAEKVLAQKPEEQDSEDNPKTKLEYSFDFSWKDGRGKVWAGKFVNKVPDLRTRLLVGSLRSQFANNLPMASLDPGTQEMSLVIAHLTFSLIKRPKWAEDLGALRDYQLIQAIYEEVANHEATFLGYGAATEIS